MLQYYHIELKDAPPLAICLAVQTSSRALDHPEPVPPSLLFTIPSKAPIMQPSHRQNMRTRLQNEGTLTNLKRQQECLVIVHKAHTTKSER